MEIRLSEVVGALSHALDVTHGQPPGHAARTCLLGMRIAEAIGLPATERSALFYALLLKDAGCSTNASKTAEIYGADDGPVKRDMRLTDHRNAVSALGHAVRSTADAGGPAARARRLHAVLRQAPRHGRALYAMRCERGADIAAMMGLSHRTAGAIRHLDEHWDGGGNPEGLAGEEISLLGRILCIAQSMEVFWHRGGPDAALRVARRRRGTWFDPALVDALRDVERDRRFWTTLPGAGVSSVEPAGRAIVAGPERVDRIAEAFARVVDAKSPYTGSHSEGVAEIAVALGRILGLDDDDRRTLRRAALLHDLGKLAVSNRILDKPGALSDVEWAVMRRHPLLSERILSRVEAFSQVARIAGNHHERLDGSGYPRSRTGLALGPLSRILAVADVAEALSAERPYRPAMPAEEVLRTMRGQAGTKLDATSLGALEQYLPLRDLRRRLDAAA